MSYISYLQSLGATHLFTLNNEGTLVTDDLGNSVDPTNISGGTYTFDTDPVCEGVTHSLDVVADIANNVGGALFDDRRDINNTNGNGNDLSTYNYDNGKRSIVIWYKQKAIENTTCIYEQGGSSNNFAFMGGALITWQAADAGQPFLITQSKSVTQANRSYCLVGVWEHHSQHAGSGNRILFYVNGVLQGISESTNTDAFPSHGANIRCGNSADNLKSFAETTLESQTTDKNCNFLGMFNNVSLTQAQAKEIFERSTFATVTIAADTVANMQASLDALIGNTYENTNCAIRILQATDATNFRLFVDNITFNADSNFEDISIQFVGTGILTLENTNGTEIKYTSAPPEVETTSTTYIGGGSIVVVNNTQRVTTNQTINNSTATKLVLDGSGTAYPVSGGVISEFENVSGNNVTITLTNNAPVPTLTQTSGNITLIQEVAITAPNIIDTSRVQINNVTKSIQLDNSVVSGGNGYSLTVNLQSFTANVGDVIELKATHQSGNTAKVPLKVLGILTSTGLSFIDTQENLTAYPSLNTDGSTAVEYNIDPNTGHLQIDANDSDCISSKKRIVARYYYLITTADGIDRFFNAIILEDEANAVIDRSITSLMVDNIGGCTINLIDNDFRLYTSDGSAWVQDPPTGGYGIISDSGKVYAVNQDQIETIVNAIKAKTDLFTFTGNDVKATLDDEIESIADAVWDQPYNQHTTAGSFGKLMDLLRKSNRAIDGEVTGTPTISSFDTNLTDYTNGAFDHELMVFVSGTLDGEARPILNYSSGTFTFEEQWTQVPSVNDEFVILPYHTHPISEIQEGLGTILNQKELANKIKKASRLQPPNTTLPDN